MTEREREREKLIELLEEADQVAQAKGITDYKDAIADNADHLLSNGVIVPPCKVGDTIWGVKEKHTATRYFVTSIEMDKFDSSVVVSRIGDTILHRISAFRFNDFGKTVFLTKEEALKALKERSEGK